MGRRHFTTSLEEPLLKALKKLAIDLDRTVNDLLEEGIRQLLIEYGKKAVGPSNSDGSVKRIGKKTK